MIKLIDLLCLHSISQEEIEKTSILFHTQKKDKKNLLGKYITAYDLWRSDFDNQNKSRNRRNLDTKWEYFNRTHGKNTHGNNFLKISEYFLSFNQIPITKEPLFAGFYKVKNIIPLKDGVQHPLTGKPMKNSDEYILEYDSRLKEFEGRLILGGWGKSNRNIKKILKKRENREKLFVESILKNPPEHKFSHQNFLWSSDKISILPHSWKNHLSQLFGIYILVDRNGNQYVGSASSKEGGFLSRWKQYQKNGHGGNKKLKNLKKEKQIYTLSILEIVPSSYTKNQVIELENKWKIKLGTRTHGLNSN